MLAISSIVQLESKAAYTGTDNEIWDSCQSSETPASATPHSQSSGPIFLSTYTLENSRKERTMKVRTAKARATPETVGPWESAILDARRGAVGLKG